MSNKLIPEETKEQIRTDSRCLKSRELAKKYKLSRMTIYSICNPGKKKVNYGGNPATIDYMRKREKVPEGFFNVFERDWFV